MPPGVFFTFRLLDPRFLRICHCVSLILDFCLTIGANDF